MMGISLDKSAQLDFTRSRELQARAHALIPGGCHTYAKGDDQFPERAPGLISHGKGCHVWDIDGNEFIEYGMGCRAVTLGHAYEPVIRAAEREMRKGANFSRAAEIEVACAELFLELIDRADMVKFAKDGSSATTAAVKLARAHTGRDHVALCADHPFFSTADWFIGTTALDAGIPQCVKDLSLKFHYNDLASVQALFDQYPNKIAGLILEPAKYEDPQDRFLHKVQELCRKNGTVFILDEMITGFRLHNGGGQALYDITPDLSTFGKALANGFSLSALAGRRDLMELGGLHHDKQRVFLLSTTHGAETHAMAAGMETIRTYQQQPIIETMVAQGTRLADGIRQVVDQHGLTDFVQVLGKPSNMVFVTKDQDGKHSQGFRSLLLQESIQRGVIMPSLVISAAHTNDDVDKTIEAIEEAMHVYEKALNDGFDKYLVGRPSQMVYRKYN